MAVLGYDRASEKQSPVAQLAQDYLRADHMEKFLSNLLHEQLKDLPRVFLVKKIEKKIEDAGVTKNVTEIAEALSKHLLSGGKGDFNWDDGSNAHKSIDLTFTEKDTEDIEKSVKSFLKDDLPDILTSTVSEIASNQLKTAKKEWPQYHIWERGQHQIFKDNLELRWGKGLNLLRLLLSETLQIGQLKLDALLRSKAKKNIRKREVLLMLHLRAAQTTAEIITLIENGYADGAMARWRTLYELRIVAGLVEKFGDEIAVKYLDHEHVTTKREMDNEIRHSGSEDIDPDHVKVVNDNFAEVINLYGNSFASPYGWAAETLNKKKPTFQDLEISVGLPELPPNYKMASYRVHAGVAGLVSGLGILGEGTIPIAGASNAGLQMPAINTAYTLVQFTGLLFGNLNRMADQLHVAAIVKLRDEIETEFVKAARKLERDEMKIQRSS
ncbi:DUF5677 domain-containing protein [Roseibium sp. FZY0029]|uniref:DUF5677 domain-containing protein n=1 Tax=Roseibium sp. FZY0029 TaxID=3116647 RepID=UPI002EBF9C05|nr:DUF5677 domain-containing protein [Roseibium sp. FZY0029]